MRHDVNARTNPDLVRVELWQDDIITEQLFQDEAGMSQFGFISGDGVLYRLPEALVDFIITNIHIPAEEIAEKEGLPFGFVNHLRDANLNYGDAFYED